MSTDQKTAQGDSEKFFGQVPPYVSYDARDAQYNNWLTPEYKVKFDAICDGIKRVIDLQKKKKSPFKYFTPHEEDHFRAVEYYLYKLIPGDKYLYLSEAERFYLLGAAWLHDIGMSIYAIYDEYTDGDYIRKRHNELSQKLLCERSELLGVDSRDAEVFGQLSYYHRKQTSIDECPEFSTGGDGIGKGIRLRLLAAYLRLADGLDIAQNRVPDEAYAIVMTYGMPDSAKIHWIRSKLIKGIIVDPTASLLRAIVKYPKNIGEFIKKKDKTDVQLAEFNDKITKLYQSAIVSELRNELGSVKNVLIQNNISSYINVECSVEECFFEEKLLQQVWVAVDADIFLHGPSSSTVYRIVLETMLDIINNAIMLPNTSNISEVEKSKTASKEHKATCIQVEYKKDALREAMENLQLFITNMYDTAKDVRRCHFGLIKMLRAVRNLLAGAKTNYIDREKKWLISKISGYLDSSSELCLISPRIRCIFQSYIEFLNEREFGKSNIILFLKTYAEVLLLCCEIDKQLVRNNAQKFIAEQANHSERYVKWICDNFIRKNMARILNTVNSDVPFQIPQRNIQFWKAEAGGCPYLLHNDKQCPAPNPDESDPAVPTKMGILFYGFSTYSIRTLCGFRDYILARMLDEITKKYENFPPHLSKYIVARFSGKSSLEADMSNLFDIYVMEAQPKNIQSWGGTIHHDGYAYCEKIKKRGFNNVTLIADSIAGTLLSQYYAINAKELEKISQRNKSTCASIPPIIHGEPKNKDNESQYCLFPRINYLIIGANGFSEKYVYHSAGHLAAICNANERGRTEIILATQTSKFLSEWNIPGRKSKISNRSIPLESPSFIDKESFKFMKSYQDENIRTSAFIPYDSSYFANEVNFYTPSEEKIRFFELDYVITEKCCSSTLELASQEIPKKDRPAKSTYARGPKKLVDRCIMEPEADYSQNTALLEGFATAGAVLAQWNCATAQEPPADEASTPFFPPTVQKENEGDETGMDSMDTTE